ncbi:MAG: type II toxin-antitoxin system RelE/ParE family toxin [Rhodospirillales bacterium]
MTPKPIIPRRQADRDIEEAIDHYRDHAGGRTARGFVDALQRAFRHIARNPASGSMRYAHPLELPGLRCWPLRRYPYLVFYVDRESHVDVWRVLHGTRDIPAWLQEPDSR